MNMWTEIRRLVLTEQKSKRAICEEYEIHWKTLQKILAYEEPPGYRSSKPRARPKLGPFLPIIHEILKQDQKAPKKQRHTAKRIFERLRDEYGYEGKLTVVKDAVRAWKQTRAEVFMPLSHRPGEAQVDFGEATVVLCGEAIKVAYFVMSLTYSDAFFCQAFHRECTETFQEGHRRAFEFFGGVFEIAVAKTYSVSSAANRRPRQVCWRRNRHFCCRCPGKRLRPDGWRRPRPIPSPWFALTATTTRYPLPMPTTISRR